MSIALLCCEELRSMYLHTKDGNVPVGKQVEEIISIVEALYTRVKLFKLSTKWYVHICSGGKPYCTGQNPSHNLLKDEK